MPDVHNRRAFLRAAAAAGVALSAAQLGEVDEALAWAGQAARQPAAPAWAVLTPAQAAVLDAMTSRLLPAVDGRPGAHEAGVVFYIDRALETFNAGARASYAAGVSDLDARAAKAVPGSSGFVSLDAAYRDQLLREIEQTPFFGAVHFDTIVGAFGVPALGGNRDYAGWHLIGMDHQPMFQAPFGYYDADANRSR